LIGNIKLLIPIAIATKTINIGRINHVSTIWYSFDDMLFQAIAVPAMKKVGKMVEIKTNSDGFFFMLFYF